MSFIPDLSQYVDCISNIDCNILYKILLSDQQCLSNETVCELLKKAIKKDSEGNIYLDLPIRLIVDALYSGEELIIGDETDYLHISETGEVTLFGNARVKRHFYIWAPSFRKPAANFPDDGWEGLFSTLDFDRNTEQSAYFTLNVPYRVDVTENFNAHVFWLHDTNQADALKFVRWGIEFCVVGVGNIVNGVTVTITQDSAGHNTDQGKLLQTNFTNDITGLAIHDQVGIRFFRDIADDLTEDARLIMLHIEFIMNKLGEGL